MGADARTTEERAARELGENARHSRRNHLLGVVSGMFAGTARDFLHPTLILAGLIYTLTGSTLLVALVTILNKAGVLAPQLLVSRFVEHTPRRRPYFIAVTVVRCTAFAALVGAMWLLSGSTTTLTLTLFFAVYLLTRISGGVGHVIYTDMVGRLIPPHRVGAFLGMRRFLGGSLAILAGMAIIQPILSGVEFPGNYVLLAGIGTALVIVDMTTFSMCREEPGPSADDPTTVGESLRRGMEWLKEDRNYRCYFWMRVAFRINYLALAFFIPYGTEQLESGAGMALLGGIMVATMKLSRVGGSALWGKVADLKGSRATLIGAGAFMLMAPALALLAPMLPPVFAFPLPGVERSLDLPLLVYLLALASMGFGIQANGIGGKRFLITSAPKERRPSYVAFLNTITSPLTLLPLLGAWVAQQAGMRVLFALLLGGGLLSLTSALRMNPTHALREDSETHEDAT